MALPAALPLPRASFAAPGYKSVPPPKIVVRHVSRAWFFLLRLSNLTLCGLNHREPIYPGLSVDTQNDPEQASVISFWDYQRFQWNHRWS